MSITLSPNLQTFALVAGNGLENASAVSINSAGNAGYTIFAGLPGSINFNGTTPVGMSVSPPTTEINEIYGPGGIFDQIYALSPVVPLADITVPINLFPGTYEFQTGVTGGSGTISSTITLVGNSTDQWVFRSTGALNFVGPTMGSTGFGFSYIGSPNSCNIYWASNDIGDITFNAAPSNPDLIIPGTFVSGRDFFHNNFSQGFLGPVFARGELRLTPSLFSILFNGIYTRKIFNNNIIITNIIKITINHVSIISFI